MKICVTGHRPSKMCGHSINYQYPIYNFYTGKKNYSGKTIEDILNYSNHQLEISHNYIQWLFPTDEKSKFNVSAPVLTKDEQIMMIYSSSVQNNLEKSFWKMMNFYGYQKAGNRLEQDEEFEKRAKNWLTKKNHNYLRITRILKSLCLLGRSDLAEIFFAELENEYKRQPDRIGENTFLFWKKAMQLMEENYDKSKKYFE